MNELQKFDPVGDLAKYNATDPNVTYRAFDFLIDALIGVNQRNRTERDKHYVQQYARDFCTVRVDIGRRCGKTSYLMKRAEGKRDTILIVATNDLAHRVRYENKMVNLIVASRIKHPVLSLESRDMPYREILVDEPSLCFAQGGITLDAIYQAYAAPKIEQTFIFLGA